MNTVIFCNGELSVSRKNIDTITSQADMIIAADGGANHLEKLHIKPHLIVGDMDSITAKNFLEDETIEKIVYETEKNQTDTELAIIEALRRGGTPTRWGSQITLLGATGNRFDHTLANIELIKKYPWKVSLIDRGIKVIAINSDYSLEIKGKKGSIVSIFLANNTSPSIKTSGLKYALNNQKLLFPSHGTSNVIEHNPASIKIDSGLILVCTDVTTSTLMQGRLSEGDVSKAVTKA